MTAANIANWIPRDTVREEIRFSDEEIEAHFDESPFGVCIDNVAFTRDTLADFRNARKTFAEPGSIEEETLGGHPALIIEKVQVEKGSKRKSVVVIDYGTVRAAVSV
jgi:hypothetical protein